MSVTVAQGRINIYQFLSFLFNREVTADFYLQLLDNEIMSQLIEKGYLPSKAPDTKELEKVIEELQCEFAKLFIGPGKHLPPYESVHIGDGENSGLLWGKTTSEVYRFFKHYGFNFTAVYGGIPDHLSIEFEFMWRMIAEEKKALEKGDSQMAERSRMVQREFFNKHIKTWVPLYCDKITSWTENHFYRGVAELAKDFTYEEDRLLNDAR
jgi:TorA maturation chaperone TorD